MHSVDLMVFFLVIFNPIMQGISTVVVLVHVELGLTYEVDNKTSTIRFASAASSNDDTSMPY